MKKEKCLVNLFLLDIFVLYSTIYVETYRHIIDYRLGKSV